MASSLRRLPVLQNTSPEDEEAARRPIWQWVGLGALLVFALWLPLAVVALWTGAGLTAHRLGGTGTEAIERFLAHADAGDRILLAASTLAPVLGSFFLAAVLGGAILGRFGTRTRPRHAALAGGGAAALATGLAAAGGALSPWPIALVSFCVLAGTGVAGGGLGGKWGARRRGGGSKRKV